MANKEKQKLSSHLVQGVLEPQEVAADRYDDDYFERGVQIGISGYVNYSWMPELTLRMAHYMIRELPLITGEKILDFGCAKGFLVHALRILDQDAYGADVSDYALSCVPRGTDKHCYKINQPQDIAGLNKTFDWLIAKDVFEHLSEAQLASLLAASRRCCRRIFAAIPLGHIDGRGFIIPSYDQDVTHITIKPRDWWITLFEKAGFRVLRTSFSFPGMKENWTRSYPKGNLFITAERTDYE